jgi:formylmethanofuran dehydrogenase subunit E
MRDDELLQIYEKATEFHRKRAPGLLIAAAMIDGCRERLGEVKDRINAVCESVSCLSDVIQLMTGCTIGNRYLTIEAELGRFALTLFDRFDGRGIRGFIDLDRISAKETPELYNFFYRCRSPEVKAGGSARLKSGEQIIREFLPVREKIMGFQNVIVDRVGKPVKPGAARCRTCGESYLQTDGNSDECIACRGEHRYYKPA